MSAAPAPPLLELLWPDEGKTDQLLARLGAEDWAHIERIAAQHRLRPLLHHRACQVHPAWPVPAAIRESWSAAHRRSALRALRQKAELERIARLFRKSGIQGIVLKGGGFVWRGWTDPAIRPMRDLDILVPEDAALDAYHLLLRNGFAGADAPAATSAKHLPTLTAQPSGVPVEIHTRLFEALDTAGKARETRFRSAALEGAASDPADDRSLASLASTDTLLHVILHAVLDHQFNNGPLLLLDVALLAEHGTVDWSLFWNRAESLGFVRPCQLALRLAERHAGVERIQWAGNRPDGLDEGILAGAAGMMFALAEESKQTGWILRLTRSGGAAPLPLLRLALNRRRSTRNLPLRLLLLLGDALRSGAHILDPKRGHRLQESLAVGRWLRGR